MNEIHWLRIIACLSVVLTHAVSRVLTDFSVTGDERVLYRTFQMMLLYGTPMFVLISTIVMTHAYKEKIPQGFLKKRVSFILIPYMVMATFYASDKFYRYNWTINDFAKELGYNLIGQWHGYFVLIIFQFYLIHLLFIKYMKKYKPLVVLTISFVISVGYWISFYFYWIDYVNQSSYLTLFFSRILFVGWLFYYVVAFYCGRNYERFTQMLNKNWLLILVGTVASALLVQTIFHSGLLMRVTSARFDLIPYTVFIFFLFFYMASKVRRVPRSLVLISVYSYGIYLLHPFAQTVTSRFFSSAEISEYQYLLIQFLAGVVMPMIIIFFISQFRYGVYMIGKTPVRTRKTSKQLGKPKIEQAV